MCHSTSKIRDSSLSRGASHLHQCIAHRIKEGSFCHLKFDLNFKKWLSIIANIFLMFLKILCFRAWLLTHLPEENGWDVFEIIPGMRPAWDLLYQTVVILLKGKKSEVMYVQLSVHWQCQLLKRFPMPGTKENSQNGKPEDISLFWGIFGWWSQKLF